MRDVSSAFPTGFALLVLSSSLALAQTPTPATPPGNAATLPAGGIATWWWGVLVVIVIAAVV